MTECGCLHGMGEMGGWGKGVGRVGGGVCCVLYAVCRSSHPMDCGSVCNLYMYGRVWVHILGGLRCSDEERYNSNSSSNNNNNNDDDDDNNNNNNDDDDDDNDDNNNRNLSGRPLPYDTGFSTCHPHFPMRPLGILL